MQDNITKLDFRKFILLTIFSLLIFIPRVSATNSTDASYTPTFLSMHKTIVDVEKYTPNKTVISKKNADQKSAWLNLSPINILPCILLLGVYIILIRKNSNYRSADF